MNIGSLLRKLRTDRNLTLDTVAKALNIGKSTLSEYETNITQPSLDRFFSLVDFYGIDPLLLLKGKEYIDITDYGSVGKQKVYEINIIEKNKKTKNK